MVIVAQVVAVDSQWDYRLVVKLLRNAPFFVVIMVCGVVFEVLGDSTVITTFAALMASAIMVSYLSPPYRRSLSSHTSYFLSLSW